MHSAPAPLDDIRVVEFAGEFTAHAGKLLAGLGAEVILVEPTGGHPTRAYGPFADDDAQPERSLWWWHHQTSKRSITVDPVAEPDLVEKLLASADIILESDENDELRRAGLDEPGCRRRLPESLIWIQVTQFGRSHPRHRAPAVDLTILAEGGPVWSCGYDDHDLPPVRGAGNQGFQTAGHYAVMSALVALAVRDRSGRGQFIEVSAHAAANVTTEVATYGYLANGEEVLRQTGRHAAPTPTMETQFRCADGVHVNSGVPPRRSRDYEAMIEWLEELGLDADFPETAVLRLGIGYERITLSLLAEDPLVGEIFAAGRKVQAFLASRLTADEYFHGSMQRGLPAGKILAPDEVLEDPHFVARGFPVRVEHEDLDRSVLYPGSPIRFTASPMRPPTRSPFIDEHGDAIRADLSGGQDQHEERTET